MKGIPETMVCEIFMSRWSFGALFPHVSISQAVGRCKISCQHRCLGATRKGPMALYYRCNKYINK